MTRREICRGLVAAPALLTARNYDVKIVSATASFEEFRYRAPYMFGGRNVDRVTLLNVIAFIRGADGRTARGFGSMPMGNVWAWPSKVLDSGQTLTAMKALAGRIAKLTEDHAEWGHPIELNHVLEPQYLAAATEVSKSLAEPIPKLCTLVTASAFDAALHDAYGKLFGRNAFDCLAPEMLGHDLSRYLGPEFRGESLQRYILPKPQAAIPMFHSVGASDAIFPDDVKSRLNDGLPESLPGWIRYNGLTHLKIKLNGGNLPSDLARVIRIDKAATSARASNWKYSLDFNEGVKDIDALMGFLEQLKATAPAAFGRILYVEQPTARKLVDIPANDMRAAAKLRPVVIDESLTGTDMLELAIKMGYSGVALKVCKGQSQAVMTAALAQKRKTFLCVQDLTCPGASLVHSVELAARVPGVRGIEMNSREYVPAANTGWEKKFPGVFKTKDGQVRCGAITGPGLGVV